MSSSPASQLHHTLVHAVEHDWFPAMCDGFVLVSGDTIDKASRSLSSSQLCQERSRTWRHHFTLRRKSPSTPVRPIPSSMSQAGQLLHSHFKEIVNAVWEHFNDYDHNFQQQVGSVMRSSFLTPFVFSFSLTVT